MLFIEVAEAAVEEYLKLLQQSCEPDVARLLTMDFVQEMTQHHVIIEEPECCDAIPRIEWLHHASCPEVQARHAQHDPPHNCLVCAAQKREDTNSPEC